VVTRIRAFLTPRSEGLGEPLAAQGARSTRPTALTSAASLRPSSR
jgi:hypothetical protein